jgi:hypothetical protein
MAKRAPGVKTQAIKEYLAENKDASPRQIVDGLKAKGIDVSFGLASVVKYKKPGNKKASAKKAKRMAMVQATAEPVVTSSELIRQYIARNPQAKPREIEAGLKAEGVKVKLSLVNAVKYSKAKKGAKKRRSRSPVVQAAVRATPSTTLGFEQLIEVKKLADSLGGADQLRAALEALAQLQ